MDEPIGQVITFYSYKGGTGRSMAMANLACLLAQQGRKVLAIDWDLEAPGLHRYFEELVDQNPHFHAKPGLIDLFYELDFRLQKIASDNYQSEEEAAILLSDFPLSQYFVRTSVPSLTLMKAGRFDRDYGRRTNSFPWEAFYTRSPWLIRNLGQALASSFDYVLIDSRTGITDTSGICTMLLPEKLVVVFTPNRQSILGAAELVERAVEYRRISDDPRPLLVFPLPSRVEPAEPQLREQWRFGIGKGFPGFQGLFEELFSRTYEVTDCSLQKYFDDVQIQHLPRYAFGESIAVLKERSEDRLSLSRAFRAFAEKLTCGDPPWSGPKSLETILVEKQYAEQRVAELAGSVGTATRAGVKKGVLLSIASLLGMVLIIAAIAIPNLMRSRLAANDASAVSSVRTINTAQVTYLVSYNIGYACDIKNLGPSMDNRGSNRPQPSSSAADLIDEVLAQGEKSGYHIGIVSCAKDKTGVIGYQVNAVPITIGETGSRIFCSDETGVIRTISSPSDKCEKGSPLQ